MKKLFFIFIFIFLFSAFQTNAEEISNLPSGLSMPQMLGRVEGAGTHFEITDSEYLNLKLSSSETIQLTFESIPEMVTMMFEPTASSTPSTLITIGGFLPNTTYYKYQDDYHNLIEFTTDKNGDYSYEQDISQPHLVFIQPRKSTKFIKDDPAGGDCSIIGVWDATTKTCALTKDVYETIQIDSNNITLDGNEHAITGAGTGYGVYLYQKTGVTIKNLEVKNFYLGIYLDSSRSNTIDNNIISLNTFGINVWWYSYGNTITNNTVTSNKYYGINVGYSGSNTIGNNTIDSNQYLWGIMLVASGNNTLTGNIISNNNYNFAAYGWYDAHFNNNIDTTNTADGKPIYYVKDADNVIYDNMNVGAFYCIRCNNVTIKNLALTQNFDGLYLWKTTNSKIENITSSNNRYGIRLEYSINNSIINSIINTNEFHGIHITTYSNDNIITGNTISLNQDSGIGIWASNNKVYNNNFVNNSLEAYSAGGNIFYLPLPIGGNYWSKYNTLAEGCSDINNDNNCDSPYRFTRGQDNFPWTMQDGWKNPQPLRPTILLPGILGSWTDNFFEPFTNPNPIAQNKLSLTEESQSWIWKQLDDLGYLPHAWQLPKTFLPVAGHPVYKCPYDWRNNNQYNAEHYLIPCIDKAKQETGASKVNIVAHSMGGLVARAYVQNDALYQNDIARLAFVGTPNHGSPEAYYFWEGADLTHGWFGILGAVMEKVVGGRLFQMGVHYARMGTVAYAHGFFPSMQELLPTFDYLKDQFGNTRDIAAILWQNTLLKDINTRPNITKLTNPVTSKVFAGEGHPTLETIRVLHPNPDNLAGNLLRPYPDGQPIPLLEENSLSGDGTVLSQKSAKITETDALFEIKTKMSGDPENFLEHANLPNSFFNEILTFLGGTATTTPSYAPRFPDAMLAVSLASPADLLVIGPDGKKLGFDTPAQTEVYEITKGIYSGRNNLELAAIIDPQPGKYTVLVTGNDVGEFNTGISYAKKECEGAVSQDNYGVTATGTVTVFTLDVQGGCGKDAVDYSLDSTVDIDPNTLNLSSKGSYITAYIELPNLYKVEDIDILNIRLNDTVSALTSPTVIEDYDNDGIRDLMLKFDRGEVQKIVSIGRNELILSGNLVDGTKFAGKDTLNIINNPLPQKLFGFFDFLFVLLGKFSLASVFSSFK